MSLPQPTDLIHGAWSFNGQPFTGGPANSTIVLTHFSWSLNGQPCRMNNYAAQVSAVSGVAITSINKLSGVGSLSVYEVVSMLYQGDQ